LMLSLSNKAQCEKIVKAGEFLIKKSTNLQLQKKGPSVETERL
jgi:hypothetical protein